MSKIIFNEKDGELQINGKPFFENIFSEVQAFPRNIYRNSFKIDAKETENEYLIEAELPGLQREEISLNIDGKRLTIAVSKAEETVCEGGKFNYIHRERRISSMSRTITLPEAENTDIRAKLADGVLSVIVPKKPKPQTSFKIDID